MERERPSGPSERVIEVLMRRDHERAVRMWAVEQMMGSIVSGQSVTMKQVVMYANRIAQYVLTGETGVM